MTENALLQFPALRNPKIVDQALSTRYVTNRTVRFSYFSKTSERRPASSSTSSVASSPVPIGHGSPQSCVFCGESPWDGACSNPAGRYGFVKHPDQITAQLNDRPKGDVGCYHCEANLTLPRNRTPCSTLAVPIVSSTGFWGRPYMPMRLRQMSRMQNMTDLHGDGVPFGRWELGSGRNGFGLVRRDIANVEKDVYELELCIWVWRSAMNAEDL
ncbi:MAG: hypothetical protein Q9196_005441 [Gyalolechia fulgens]